jgi:predicted kinase
MTRRENVDLPMLVVVTGRPAAGKTTLAHTLARAIRCPVISRDEIKEGYINAIKGSKELYSDPDGHVYTTFFETIEFLLSKHITLIAEAAFQHKVWTPKLEPLRKIARIRLIYCTVDPQLAMSRFIERSTMDIERVQFHADLTSHASKEIIENLINNYEPPHIDVPMITVDTSDGYTPTLEDILSFIGDAIT